MRSDADFLADAVRLATETAATGAHPFAALVVRDGEVLARAANAVVRDADPLAHAEVVAIRSAARRHGPEALGGATLVSSAEPCPLCRGAAALVGIGRTIHAASAELAARHGWRLPPGAAALATAIGSAGLADVEGVETPGSEAPFERYAAATSGGPREVPRRPVDELRVALTVFDYDEAIGFYRDALGLPVVHAWDEPTGRGTILDAGRATLEVISPEQARHIDAVEVGRDVAGRVRLALEVEDSAATGERLVAAGARAVGGPVETPWRHRNVRVAAPDGLQLTLFTVLPDAPPEG